MRIRITLLSLLASLLSTGFVFTSAPVANAGCRDYPESVTPACAAQNLAEEQARQAADVAKRAQDLIDAEVEELGGQTFFSALNSEETVAFFGGTAISEYLEAPLSGFFMGSPKAFLAVQLSDSQKELFTRVMTLVLTEIQLLTNVLLRLV